MPDKAPYWTDDDAKIHCAARRGKTDPPQDCDWPFCGCDPHAERVIATLQECDLLRPRTPPPSGDVSLTWSPGVTVTLTPSEMDDAQLVSQPDGWQPIDGAPKDGTVFYIYHPRGIRRAWWASDRLYYEAPGRGEMVDDVIAHWMPMQATPRERA